MLARHLPLLWVFAGGCVSGATLIIFFRDDGGSDPSPKEQRASEQATEPSVPPAVVVSAVQDDTPSIEAEVVEAASPSDATAPDDDSASESDGTSVADVLARLEAAYREGLAAAAPAPAPAASAAAPAPAATAPAPQPAAPAPTLAAAPTTAPPAAAPEAPVASLDNAKAGDVHIGDVNQNTTNVENLHQGDAYMLQQLAYLQYVQSFPLWAGAQVAANPQDTRPGVPPRGAWFVASTNGANGANGARFVVSANLGQGTTTRGSPTFSFPIINPDNPWGYDFPPPVLVK